LWKVKLGDVTLEGKFLSHDYTNPNTNPKSLTLYDAWPDVNLGVSGI